MKSRMTTFSNFEWTMPFLFTQGIIFLPVLKELLGDEFNIIKSVYGSTQCLFAGGRPTTLSIKNVKNIERTILSILNYNIIPSFTLTNTTLTKEDLNDPYSNEILKIISNANANAIVYSDILYDYIKEKYPNIKLTASVIKFLIKTFDNLEEETQYINSLIDNYDKVVIRSEYLMKNEKLIGIKDTSKLILLVNSTCKPDCPFSQKHYDLISKFHKQEITYQEGFNEFRKFCPKITERNMNENTISYKQIETAYKCGVRTLKLQGRQQSFEEMFNSMYKYHFFNKKLNKEKLRNQINKICANKLQNSLDLQIYSIMKSV